MVAWELNMRTMRSRVEKIMTDLNEAFLRYEKFMSEDEGDDWLAR